MFLPIISTILCLSETYLDSSISSNNKNLAIPGHHLYRPYSRSNVKRRKRARVLDVYYQYSLPLKLIYIQNLQDCINFEMKIENR